ncbi:MAG TPA: hypothetical protein VGK90_06575 [Rhizomicrobium sp.]|jgi:hypothetical protein
MMKRALLLTAALSIGVTGSASASAVGPNAHRPGSLVVKPALGGVIFGFDVDQNGTEGVLSEALTTDDKGDCTYATETFDQSTGKVTVISKKKSSRCGDDDVTWGVVGSSVGFVEHQRSPTFDHLRMSFPVLNPLDGNSITGAWKSPFKKTAEIEAVSRNQGSAMNAFQVYDFATQMEYVFGSDVAKNKLEPVLQITSTPGILGLNTLTNTAVVTIGSENPFGPPTIAQIALAHDKVTTFQGIGSGTVQGLAVDSADDIAVTTTYGDAGVEFYNLADQSSFEEVLPNCSSPACSGFDVEFDSVNKLFLVAQPISSQVNNQSTIYVYDTQGNLVETLNGLNFYTERFDVIPVHIALNPGNRTGFVDLTNNLGTGAIQSFAY